MYLDPYSSENFLKNMEQREYDKGELAPRDSSVELSTFVQELLSTKAQEVLHFFMHGILTGRVQKTGYAIFEVSAHDFFLAFPQYGECTDGQYPKMEEVLEELVHIFVEYNAYNHEGKRQLWGCDHLIGGVGYDMSKDAIMMEMRFEAIERILQELEGFAGFEMTLQKKVGEVRRPGGRKYEPVYKKVCIKEYTGPRYVYGKRKVVQKLLDEKKSDMLKCVEQPQE